MKVLKQHKFYALIHFLGQGESLLQLFGGNDILSQQIVIFGSGSKGGRYGVIALFYLAIRGIQFGGFLVKVMGLITILPSFEFLSEQKLDTGGVRFTNFERFDNIIKLPDGLGWRMHFQEAFGYLRNDFRFGILFFE